MVDGKLVNETVVTSRPQTRRYLTHKVIYQYSLPKTGAMPILELMTNTLSLLCVAMLRPVEI